MARAVDTKLSARIVEMELAGRARALLVGAPEVERRLLAPLIGTVTTASLYGRYGAGHVASDVVDLKEFEDDSFDLFEASLLFDYVPQTNSAFDSISRVLRSRSLMFFHIGEGRLREGDMAPTLKRYRSDWTATYYPADYKQPIMIFGRDWIREKLESQGFAHEEIRWIDPGTAKALTWWLAWRD